MIVNDCKKTCNTFTSIVHQMFIGRAMNAIMWPSEPKSPYDSWQAVKKKFAKNHSTVRSEINHSQLIDGFNCFFLLVLKVP